MKKSFGKLSVIFGLILLLAFPSLSASAAAYNLVNDGGIDNVIAESVAQDYANWTDGGTKVSFDVDNKIKHSGEYALKISVQNNFYATYYTYLDYKKMTPGKTYIARVFVKTENITGTGDQGVMLCVNYQKGGQTKNEYRSETTLTGTKDWTKITMEFKYEDTDIDAFTVQGIVNRANGTAWFDDFAFWEKGSEEPAEKIDSSIVVPDISTTKSGGTDSSQPGKTSSTSTMAPAGNTSDDSTTLISGASDDTTSETTSEIPSQSSTRAPKDDDEKGGINGGIIAAIIIAVLLAAGALVYFLIIKKKKDISDDIS